ncbi:Nuclear receptor coactivator 5 [Varanus komodoensis]|nr:Nuclear receptor coactivator 5 [Varanus komodoensis]
MPIPSKHIGRSQSWDAAGWYEGNWENENAFEYQRPPGRRNSLTYTGEGVWYEQPANRPHEIILQGGAELKQEPYPYQEPVFNQGPIRKGSVPDFVYYDRQPTVSARSSLPPQDYYSDPTLASRSPKDPRYYRDHMINRPLLNYGMPSARLAWDQMQVRSPAPLEASRLYRDPMTKMIPEAQRIRSRDPAPARYGVESQMLRYGTEPPTFPNRQVYSDTVDRSIDAAASRQVTPTCLVVDPNSTAAPDGSVATSLNRGYGPVRENVGAKVPYDAYETVTTPSHAQMPSSFSGQDIKRNVEPEFLALLRSEGVSESTLSALLQQGFDSPSLLAMMEDNDIKSVAPNLGQARVLSRIAHTYKAEMQLQRQDRKNAIVRPRHRSNSFSHRSELLQNEYGIHPATSPVADGTAVHQPPTASMQPVSPRVAELTRRPSSAPTQHLLETATYPAAGLPHQVAPFLPSSGYSGSGPCNMQTRQATGYSFPSGISMNALQTNPHPSPKTAYSTTYTVPMELMKRDRNPPLSPMHSPHNSPQLLRKQGAQVESNLVPAGPSFPMQHSPYQKPTRRTGPPVIVSTMASPESSNYFKGKSIGQTNAAIAWPSPSRPGRIGRTAYVSSCGTRLSYNRTGWWLSLLQPRLHLTAVRLQPIRRNIRPLPLLLHPHARPLDEGAPTIGDQPVSPSKKQRGKRKHSSPEKLSVHKKAKRDKAEKPVKKPKKPEHTKHQHSGSAASLVPTTVAVPTPSGPTIQAAMRVTPPVSPCHTESELHQDPPCGSISNGEIQESPPRARSLTPMPPVWLYTETGMSRPRSHRIRSSDTQSDNWYHSWYSSTPKWPDYQSVGYYWAAKAPPLASRDCPHLTASRGTV